MGEGDILALAEALLGQEAVRVYRHRGWAVFWCPFHPDAARRGRRGRPNFGVSLVDGHWKCLACGRAGPSLQALARELGKALPAGRERARAERAERAPAPPPPPVRRLDPLLGRLRELLLAPAGGAARAFLARRGVDTETARAYGLGYAPPDPPRVSPEVRRALAEAGIWPEGRRGWAWGNALVLAEPPVAPWAVQIRRLEPGGRPKYQTWGQIRTPWGWWRVHPSATAAVVVVEGMMDLLAFAAALARRGALPRVIPLATGGGGSREALERLAGFRGEILLVPDPDEAGEAWARRIREALGRRPVRVERPPDGLDPDEALRAGWWPEGLT